jgi:hypothetical protein
MRPGGVRAVVTESLLLKHQLVISARQWAPNLNSFDRFVFGLGSLLVRLSWNLNKVPGYRITTILGIRLAPLKKRKYRWLFSSGVIDAPAQNGHQRRAITSCSGSIVLREHAADDIFVDIDAKGQRDLLGDAGTASPGNSLTRSFEFKRRKRSSRSRTYRVPPVCGTADRDDTAGVS